VEDGLLTTACSKIESTNRVIRRFLLKYISRDEVGLHERGSDGLSEVQEAVTRYEEQSPLFGFIQYRRRKVILKYVPEGTSRLLQGTLLLVLWISPAC